MEVGVMDGQEQIQQVADELDKLIERCRIEYDLSYASVVGVLQMKTHLLCQEAAEADTDT